MNPNREEVLLALALEKTADKRAAFLDAVCEGDLELRHRLEALLAVSEEPDNLLPTRVEAARPTVKLDVAEAPDEFVGQTIGRYKLLEKVGEGGCGVVYVAEQSQPVRRRVALKVIKLGMDTKAVVARFEAERQALAMMDHPNIAKVFDGGAAETGRPYFVMELVRGIRITDYCDQNNLTTKERLDLFIKVCQAIQHAHQKGIIHRDIKPSNILVTLHDGVPVPKVIDFGIAKATEGRLTDATVYTQLHQFIGTPAYMSPEQAEMSGLDIDTRADIYSLGVLLYELLAGTTPFDATELMASGIDAMRRTIREKEPVRPSTRLATLRGEELTATAKRRSADTSKLLHQLKGDLDWIVMKCLEKDRQRRYETANGLAADLQRHLDTEPVVARPPTTAYRFQKAIRRNKVGFAAGSFVAMTLVAGIGVSTWQAVVATRAKTVEREQRLAAQTERDKAQAAQKEAQRAQEAETSIRREAEQQLYAAKMNLAQQAWEENNIGQLRQLLDDTKDSPYRGFEWYYWQQQTHLALKTLRGHVQGVRSVAFSPDGQRIVTGSLDHTARVWEASTGKELLTLKGHAAEVFSVAFSPDGQRIVTGAGDQNIPRLDSTARVWDVADGRELLTLKGHSGWVTSVAYSPDSQRIVTSSADGTAKVWDAANGKELLTLSNAIYSAAFSPDGQRIVTGSHDGSFKVWGAGSGRELLTLKGHDSGIYSLAFSPDGQRIATGSADGTSKVWDAADCRELLTLKGHSGWVSSLAYSPDGQRIVTGSQDTTAKVWDAANGKELRTLKGHSNWIFSVAFSPDGQGIVTSSEDGTTKVWQTVGNRELITLKRYSDVIDLIRSVAFSPDGHRIVTGSGDKTAKVWDAANGKELRTLTGHSASIWSVAFSPDGQRIVTGSEDKTAKVWDAVNGKELRTLKGHDSVVYSVAFSPDGQRIVTGSGDNSAKVFEAASGRELLTLTGHSASIWSVAFSPNGQRIVTSSQDRTAKVWDAANGKELLTLKGHSGSISSVAFSPDGQRIVTGSGDNYAKVFEAASGRELLTLKGHSSWIASVAFSPDGQRIVTGSDDRTAKVWEAASGRELLTLKGHSSWIASVAFSQDGLRIATGSYGFYETQAKVWEAARAEQVAAWQEEEAAAAKALAPLEREFMAEQERQRIARGRSFIKQWLILAPIALATDQTGAQGLDIEQIEGEGRLRPKVGEAKAIGGAELKWREVVLENSVIDLNAIVGQETALSVAYAVCYLRSEAQQRGLQMLVGSDDEAKIYLNGKEVYKAPVPRAFIEEQDTVPDIALNAGVNVLVFKVVNEGGGWLGSLRLTDAQGNPVNGIKVTLDPEAKDSP